MNHCYTITQKYYENTSGKNWVSCYPNFKEAFSCLYDELLKTERYNFGLYDENGELINGTESNIYATEWGNRLVFDYDAHKHHEPIELDLGDYTLTLSEV